MGQVKKEAKELRKIKKIIENKAQKMEDELGIDYKETKSFLIALSDADEIKFTLTASEINAYLG